MQSIVIDRLAWSVCRSVGHGLSVTLVSPAKTGELIEMPFGLRTRVGPRDHVLDGGSDPPMGRGKFWGENGRPMLANTIEPSVCGGDAVLCQITLTTCYFPHSMKEISSYRSMQAVKCSEEHQSFLCK